MEKLKIRANVTKVESEKNNAKYEELDEGEI